MTISTEWSKQQLASVDAYEKGRKGPVTRVKTALTTVTNLYKNPADRKNNLKRRYISELRGMLSGETDPVALHTKLLQLAHDNLLYCETSYDARFPNGGTVRRGKLTQCIDGIRLALLDELLLTKNTGALKTCLEQTYNFTRNNREGIRLALHETWGLAAGMNKWASDRAHVNDLIRPAFTEAGLTFNLQKVEELDRMVASPGARK